MKERDELLRIAAEASIAAGDVIMRRFRKRNSVRFKSKANPVTDVDLLAERTIVDILSRHFPQHNILSEEEHTVDNGSEYTWVIDPLDGTMNFTQGIPFIAVSVALALEGKPFLGCIYDPVRKEAFTAVQGNGAFLNGKPIAVSKKQLLQDAVVGLDLGYDDMARHRALETALSIRPQIQSIRIPGSAVLGLCYVACGRFDIYFHPLIYPWDIVGGTVLVAEAGGQVTDLYGKDVTLDTSNIAASNHSLHEQFMDVASALLV